MVQTSLFLMLAGIILLREIFLRSSENGLSVMSAPKGTYIAYSTAPGELALMVQVVIVFFKQMAENLFCLYY